MGAAEGVALGPRGRSSGLFPRARLGQIPGALRLSSSLACGGGSRWAPLRTSPGTPVAPAPPARQAGPKTPSRRLSFTAAALPASGS